MEKTKVLAKFLELDPNDISENTDGTFSDDTSNAEYRVMTEEEAQDAARESILESVWAFNPEFLAAHAREGIDAEVIQAIQANGRCEDNNRALTALIDDVDHFVDDAINADGRGHFLAPYDSEEHEFSGLYIYRTN